MPDARLGIRARRSPEGLQDKGRGVEEESKTVHFKVNILVFLHNIVDATFLVFGKLNLASVFRSGPCYLACLSVHICERI